LVLSELCIYTGQQQNKDAKYTYYYYFKGRSSDCARAEVPLLGAAFNPRIVVMTS
jgi:hypothetical protein